MNSPYRKEAENPEPADVVVSALEYAQLRRSTEVLRIMNMARAVEAYDGTVKLHFDIEFSGPLVVYIGEGLNVQAAVEKAMDLEPVEPWAPPASSLARALWAFFLGGTAVLLLLFFTGALAYVLALLRGAP